MSRHTFEPMRVPAPGGASSAGIPHSTPVAVPAQLRVDAAGRTVDSVAPEQASTAPDDSCPAARTIDGVAWVAGGARPQVEALAARQ